MRSGRTKKDREMRNGKTNLKGKLKELRSKNKSNSREKN